MATQNISLIRANDTLANFASWATAKSQFIGGFGITGAGWVQKADIGTVQWWSCNITNCSMAGSVATYTYNTFSGLGQYAGFSNPVAGMVVTISGYTGGNTGCNGTFLITSVNTGASTFNVTNATGVTNAAAANVVRISAVPALGSCFEIWQPNDGKTNFYLRVDYGSNTSPTVELKLGVNTDGSGHFTGITSNQITVNGTSSVSTVATFNCFMSGDAEHLVFAMWCDDYTNSGQIGWGVQRSKNNSGTPTSDYVALLTYSNNGTASIPCSATWMSFTLGTFNAGGSSAMRFPHNLPQVNGGIVSGNVGGQCGAGAIFNYMGKPDNPTDLFMIGWADDFNADLQQVVPTNQPYSVAHNYVVIRGSIAYSSTGIISRCLDSNSGVGCILVRYD